MLFTSIVITLL